MRGVLTREQVDAFVRNGYVRVDEAFPSELAAALRAALWTQMGKSESDKSTWVEPVVHLSGDGPLFAEAVRTESLRSAFDQLVGVDRWWPRSDPGNFVIRFPSEAGAGDTGWHLDASFENDHGAWSVNLVSRGRALLMLFLFSDVGMNDAPTRLRVGSHLRVPRLLAQRGENGLTFDELAKLADAASDDCAVDYVVGRAGDVYLCHPFLVHAAQAHHGDSARFMSQPGLVSKDELNLERSDGNYSPVEAAVRLGLELFPQS